jgi:hypothetical protein
VNTGDTHPIQYQTGYSSLKAHSAAAQSYNSYSQLAPHFNTFTHKHSPYAHGNHSSESPYTQSSSREGQFIHPKSVRVLPSPQQYGDVTWGGNRAHSPSNQKPQGHNHTKDTIAYENGNTVVANGVLV